MRCEYIFIHVTLKDRPDSVLFSGVTKVPLIPNTTSTLDGQNWADRAIEISILVLFLLDREAERSLLEVEV